MFDKNIGGLFYIVVSTKEGLIKVIKVYKMGKNCQSGKIIGLECLVSEQVRLEAVEVASNRSLYNRLLYLHGPATVSEDWSHFYISAIGEYWRRADQEISNNHLIYTFEKERGGEGLRKAGEWIADERAVFFTSNNKLLFEDGSEVYMCHLNLYYPNLIPPEETQITYRGSRHKVRRIAVSPDGKYLTKCGDTHLEIDKIDGNHLLKIGSCEIPSGIQIPNRRSLNVVTFPHGKPFFACGSCENVLLYAFDKDKPIESGHADHDSNHEEESLRLIERISVPRGESSIQFSRDGKYIARNGLVFEVDFKGPKHLKCSLQDKNIVNSFFSPDSRYIITSDTWRIPTPSVPLLPQGYFKLYEFDGREMKEVFEERIPVTPFSMSPNGRYLAAYDDNNIIIYQVKRES